MQVIDYSDASTFHAWVGPALEDQPITRDEAQAILEAPNLDYLGLVHAAGRVRQHYFDRTVSVHVLDNVRNGACPEDCGYCGQSKDSEAPVLAYKTKSVDDIVAEAEKAKANGAYRFCMALSGRGPNDRDIEHMTEAVRRVSSMGLRTCLSVGLMDEDKARKLKDAGLDRLNHNLNTARDNYANICTTHTYEDRLQTLTAAHRAGLGICSGLIVGMGESHADLVDLAFSLRDVHAASIPVNFLLPFEGNRVNTPICNEHALSPQFVLRVLCMFRFVNPTAEVRIAAGRELHLRSLQALALWPANSLFMEGYLLTKGQEADDTLRMIHDAGFTLRLDEGEMPENLLHWFDRESNPDAARETAASGEPRVQLKQSVAKAVATD